jgi:hypothetical protein
LGPVRSIPGAAATSLDLPAHRGTMLADRVRDLRVLLAPGDPDHDRFAMLDRQRPRAWGSIS